MGIDFLDEKLFVSAEPIHKQQVSNQQESIAHICISSIYLKGKISLQVLLINNTKIPETTFL